MRIVGVCESILAAGHEELLHRADVEFQRQLAVSEDGVIDSGAAGGGRHQRQHGGGDKAAGRHQAGRLAPPGLHI